MAFRNITCKLGNMRKAQEWVLYPQSADSLHSITIQCDNRIARVDLNTGKAMLSSGKGGHQGHVMLSRAMGATEVVVPADVIAKLKELIGDKPQVGGVMLLGEDS